MSHKSTHGYVAFTKTKCKTKYIHNYEWLTLYHWKCLTFMWITAVGCKRTPDINIEEAMKYFSWSVNLHHIFDYSAVLADVELSFLIKNYKKKIDRRHVLSLWITLLYLITPPMPNMTFFQNNGKFQNQLTCTRAYRNI